jgi:ATP-dependent DNA ligase
MSSNFEIIESSQPLVAKTRLGKDKFWQGHVVRQGTQWFTQASYWQINKDGVKSKVQWSDPYEATPKNVGKANETSAKDQAYSEYESMINLQLDKGYVDETTTSSSTIVRPLPMLAQKFSERGDKLQWPVLVQPKYNGMRMLYDGKTAWSRRGKDMIPEVIKHLMFDTGGLIADGELILPGNVLLQDTMSAAKKYRAGVSDKLLYIVYDSVDSTIPFYDRYEAIKWQIEKTNKHLQVLIAPVEECLDMGEVMTAHRKFTSAGFEGTIIRDNSAGYEINHRSNQLQKLKDFVDAEFKVVGVKEGNGKFKGAAILICTNSQGATFDCMPEGTMEHRRKLWDTRDVHIGKWLTVRYQELSKDKTPLFGVGVDFRDAGEF